MQEIGAPGSMSGERRGKETWRWSILKHRLRAKLRQRLLTHLWPRAPLLEPAIVPHLQQDIPDSREVLGKAAVRASGKGTADIGRRQVVKRVYRCFAQRIQFR